MKCFATRLLAIIVLIVCSGPLVADRYVAENQEECCRPICCYECSCNPLYCGALDLQVHAGIAPVIWQDRGEFLALRCPVGTVNPIFSLFEIPKFSTFFKMPWTVGGQIGYAVSDNVRVYLEANYLQARRKDLSIVVPAIPGSLPIAITFNHKRYSLIDAYVGVQYYHDRICDFASFFFGFKAGLTHHRRVLFSPVIVPPILPPTPVTFTDLVLLHRNTVPSGGVNVGVDFCFCGCWALQLMAEAVVACGPHFSENFAFGQGGIGCGQGPFPLAPVGGINNLLITHVGVEVRFPITVGIRYSF